MASEFKPDRNAPILMEFATEEGAVVAEVGIPSTDELKKKSEEAVDSALNTIYNMARKVASTVEALDVKPSQMEVSFAIKVTAKTGAVISVITEGGGEVSLDVKLTWQRKD